MSDKKQTAVEYIVCRLNKSIGLTNFVDNCDENYKQEILEIISQSLQMEKQQIVDAKNDKLYPVEIGGLQYYKETYGK